MIRRGDAARVERLNLLGVMKNVGELFREQLFLLVRELELRECGNALDIRDGESGRHEGIVMQNANTDLLAAVVKSGDVHQRPPLAGVCAAGVGSAPR